MADLTPTILLIVDGWGQAPAGPGNAVSLAETPTLDALLTLPSRTDLLCSGRAVGLPNGFMGNSEVGHMNIGAGRVVYQEMTRIDMAIEDGSFSTNPVIGQAIAAVKRSGGVLHLLGLVSDGGVHSHIDHLFALLDLAAKAQVPVAVHAFTDGRDTAPDSGIGFIGELVKRLGPGAHIATVTGRYYAMDRDKRWNRTQKAWNAVVHGQGQPASDPVAAMQAAYASGETDEFIAPRIITAQGNPRHDGRRGIRDGDAVFFLNFRADRARQFTRCLYEEHFTEFDRGEKPRLAAFASMSAYEADMPVPAAFTRQNLTDGLGETISRQGLAQLRIAETEKYAHVTYFFNGGVEEPLPGEERRLIPSPRDVPTYDLKPEMSVVQITDALLAEWETGRYPFIVCNFANMDMVGHSGNIPATIKACEAADACVARVLAAVRARKGRLAITADHGNAESMLTPEGLPRTSHSTNPVAFIIVDEGEVKRLRPGGKLGDIAPTLLALWGLEQPLAMTGQNLWEKP